ncbi:MAG: fibronectin type III-like domain-contianing protein, partial [Arcanobacterium sp.]
WPGVDEGEGFPTITYSEGLNMGYRWFQTQGIKPMFGFGYGLSYTTFEVSDVSVDKATYDGGPVTVKATVTNTGDREGAEVVQVYLGVPSKNQPPKRLVGFAKAKLEAGASETVEIVIDPAATNHPFSVWSDCAHDFVVPCGVFTVYVGTSADETPYVFTIANN